MVIRNSICEKERYALSRLRQILHKSGLMRAYLYVTRITCGKKGCRCMLGGRNRHIAWYIMQSNKGNPRRKYVPFNRLDEVRQWVRRYNEVIKLLEQISEEYWKRLIQRTNKRGR